MEIDDPNEILVQALLETREYAGLRVGFSLQNNCILIRFDNHDFFAVYSEKNGVKMVEYKIPPEVARGAILNLGKALNFLEKGRPNVESNSVQSGRQSGNFDS